MKKSGQIALFEDWLICMISTKKHQYIEGLDEIITKEASDFPQSGLKAESIIRATRIAVVSGEILVGTIGEISQERLSQIKKNLARWIESSK